MTGSAYGSGHVSLEEYLRGRFESDMEFVDGLVVKRKGFGWKHSRLVTEVGAWFWEHRKAWGVDALPSYWVKTMANRVRMPDLCVVRRSDPVEQVRVSAPLLCIEFLEPEDRMEGVTRRLDEFVAMGVENIWILDPSDRSAATYSRFGMKRVEGDRLEVAGTEIYLDVRETFAALDSSGVGTE